MKKLITVVILLLILCFVKYNCWYCYVKVASFFFSFFRIEFMLDSIVYPLLLG